MKVLVLGGTRFIGRHLVTDLLAAGHDVTLLNRGRTGPELFPELPLIRADRRAADLRARPELRRDWDAVIDLSAYFPREVSDVLEAVKGRAGRYLFCSTASVYDFDWVNGPPPSIGEEHPVLACTGAQALDPAESAYGARKAECERLIRAGNATPATIFRPCAVYGAHDPGGRLAHWIWRAAKDIPFILPEGGVTAVHRTPVSDLAAVFTAALTQDRVLGGTYNVIEPEVFTLRETMRLLGAHLGMDPLARAVDFSAAELSGRGVRPWHDLPLWIPGVTLRFDDAKLRRDLDFAATPPERALARAADSFLAAGLEPSAGFGLAREAELLAGRV